MVLQGGCSSKLPSPFIFTTDFWQAAIVRALLSGAADDTRGFHNQTRIRGVVTLTRPEPFARTTWLLLFLIQCASLLVSSCPSNHSHAHFSLVRGAIFRLKLLDGNLCRYLPRSEHQRIRSTQSSLRPHIRGVVTSARPEPFARTTWLLDPHTITLRHARFGQHWLRAHTHGGQIARSSREQLSPSASLGFRSRSYSTRIYFRVLCAVDIRADAPLTRPHPLQNRHPSGPVTSQPSSSCSTKKQQLLWSSNSRNVPTTLLANNTSNSRFASNTADTLTKPGPLIFRSTLSRSLDL